MSFNQTLSAADIPQLKWPATDGLLPAIVQDADTEAVLMLGYVNAESLAVTLQLGRVVFFSRSRQQLWEKGETSGHALELVSVTADCDQDTLLIRARPHGPTCHRNTLTCFGDGSLPMSEGIGFLSRLQSVIDERIATGPQGSYTAKLFAEGPQRIAQKVGEEGVETALAAVTGDPAQLLGESADLLFHLILLLRSRDLTLQQVTQELAARHASSVGAASR